MRKANPLFLVATISLYLLFGCSTENQPVTSSPIVTTSNFSITVTHVPVSKTPQLTTTNSNQPISLTPALVQIPKSTFDPSKAIIQTPFPPAQCPPDATGVFLPNLETLNQSQDTFEKTILETLNSGGIKEIIALLSQEQAYATAIRADLTHDSVPELIISNRHNFPGYLSIFGCDKGQYAKMLTVNADYDYAPSILKITDMNLNGMPDLALELTTCHWCTGAMVYEWDGKEFQSLVRYWFIDPSRNEVDYTTVANLDGYSDAKILDIDGNGTYEIMLQGGIPTALGDMYYNGPYRSMTIIYMWDGKYYSLYSQKYSPPAYRFQAVQDGDDASSLGNYEEALALYQDVIFSDQLKGWSVEEKENLRAQADTLYTLSPTPTTLPPHNEDYSPLAAYARYRIMLIHILNGHQNDAQVVYDAIQENFPVGNDGHPYAEMAAKFWNEYISSRDIELSCQQAINYADDHPEILLPLNGPEFSFWSKSYLPFDICPFKNN